MLKWSFKYGGRNYSFSDEIPGRVIETIKHKKRFYEQRMLQRIKNLAIPGIYIDVGANIGNHAVFFASQCKSSKVIAIEPIPEIFKVLKININLNKLNAKIQPLNLAASDTNGTVHINYRPKSRGGIAMVHKKSTGPEIKTCILDDLKITGKVAVIKIDVEGFEPFVLRGAQNIIKKDMPILLVEAKTKNEKIAVDKILNKLDFYEREVFNASATYLFAHQDDKRIQPNLAKNLKLKLQKNRLLRRA